MNLEDVKYWAVVSNQGIHPSVSMSKKEFDWLIEQAETLKEIEKVMGLSHADSFSNEVAIEDIKYILNYY